jgi:N-sulfoglucosamine sulfohydrolase
MKAKTLFHWLVLVFLSLASVCTADDRTSKPNVLFILADNWRFPTAGVLGDPAAKTPAFDRIAREGLLFSHVFNPVPSCTPTRSCLLTGRYAHELGASASLWSSFPVDTPVVTELLREAGYEVGYTGKPWGPGNFDVSGWKENPVGTKFSDFEGFHSKHDPRKPFFFWLGNTDTATKAGKLPYLAEAKLVLDANQIVVPPELPDCPEVREDLMNYYGGVMRLDNEAAKAIAVLEKAGTLDDTVIVYTSDNGWQLPRGLANCYDAGSRVPLAIRWGSRLEAGIRIDKFVNLAELGPTFLEIAGLTPPREMTLGSIKNLMFGMPDGQSRDAVFMERERHANVRQDNQSYPIRAVRTRDFLYLRNLRPERWPAGDPDVLFLHGRPYGDVDTTRVKDFLISHQYDPVYAKYMTLIFGKRPSEEFYDVRIDPHQLNNVAGNPKYNDDLQRHRDLVDDWMKRTRDPRMDPQYDGWDTFPYYGSAPKSPD